MQTIIIILFVAFCASQFFYISDENEKKKSRALCLKRLLFVAVAALAFTKVGRTIYFMFAIAIIVAISLINKKNGITA